MFQIWISKVYFILQRALSESEINTAKRLFAEKYTPSGAAEYLR